MSEPYGFAVEFTEPDEDHDVPGGWSVTLPHQCDAWEITPEDRDDYITRTEALDALDRFIGEALEVRKLLVAGRQRVVKWDPRTKTYRATVESIAPDGAD